jgi:hypothetical protein
MNLGAVRPGQIISFGSSSFDRWSGPASPVTHASSAIGPGVDGLENWAHGGRAAGFGFGVVNSVKASDDCENRL